MEPTRVQIDRLIAFRQVLDAEGFQPYLPEDRAPKRTTGSPPAYHPAVLEFFRLTGEEAWCDHGYVPQEASAMLDDLKIIECASLAQVRTMLTYCTRGERFFDGHWAAMIERGHIRRLLDRVAQISVPERQPNGP